MSAIQTVAIIGTGLIGSSWTAFYLANGLSIKATDPSPGAKDRYFNAVEEMLPGALQVRQAEHDADWKKRITFTQSLEEALVDVDLVQESALEDLELKRSLYTKMDAMLEASVIIASSTSGLSSTAFSSQCKNPERVLVAHPFSPPHILPLVEIVPGQKTSQYTVDRAIQFYAAMGKKPVLVKKEVAGFIGNRLQACLVQEAIHLLQEGVASAADIDAVMTTGLGPRWAMTGPFMTSHLGGGPNGDIKHFLEHIGLHFETYWSSAGKVHLTPELISQVAAQVDDQVKSYDVEATAIKRERDEAMIRLIKDKANSNCLV